MPLRVYHQRKNVAISQNDATRYHQSNSINLIPLDPDSEIFDPFEINDDSDHIVEYQGELDPDKNYFNQFSYYLSQSGN